MADHCRVWTCPFDCSTTFDTSASFRTHLVEAHKSTTASNSIDALIFSHQTIDMHRMEGKCPLCHEVDIKTTRQYRSHVGNHLEQLALFVLPETSDEEHSEDEPDKLAAENDLDEESSAEDEHMKPVDNNSADTPPQDACIEPDCTKPRLGGPENIPRCSMHSTTSMPPNDTSVVNSEYHAIEKGGPKSKLLMWTCVSASSSFKSPLLTIY